MIATKASAFSRCRQNGAVRKETLSAALDSEDGELTNFEMADASRNGSADLIGYNGPPPKGAFAEEQLATSKTRNCAPATAILRRHWERKSSLEEVILEIYYGNISVAKADEIARLLWNDEASAALVSECTQKIARRIQSWLQRRISEPQLYVFLHSLGVKQKINGENRVTTLFAAVGVGSRGTREILAVAGEAAPGCDSWNRLIADLKKRGLHGTKLFVGENASAAVAAVSKHFPKARYQGSLVQLERDVLREMPTTEMHFVTNAFEDIQASPAPALAATKITALADKFREDGKKDAVALLEGAAPFLFSYYHFPKLHWGRLRDSRPLRQVLSEFREWIRICGPVSDDNALILMVAARLRYASRRSWAWRCFISFKSPAKLTG